MSLYDFANGDPVNQFDADGRFGKAAIDQAFYGSYATEDNGWAGFFGEVGVGFTPAGVAADVRDSYYYLGDIYENGQNIENSAMLLATGIGFIPGVGDAIKGGVKGGINSFPYLSKASKKADNLISSRQAIAREFYETNTNWNAARIDSHLSGIDFSKPVDVVNLKSGSNFSQWNFAGESGNYFTDLGTGPSGLGVYTNGRIESVLQINTPSSALRSTAADALDTWSVPGLSIDAPGGNIQYFLPK